MVASADYLDVQIAELTKQKQEKIKILEECQKSNKGFKIAGLATLGVSAIGIGVNIGEAVKIKDQKEDIATKDDKIENLNSKISSTKILIAENNTCGPSDCQGDGSDAAFELNGAGPVCISNVWAVKSCNSGFSGTLKKCKRQGVEIEYYDACTKDTSFDTCGSDICNNEDKEAVENRLHGKPAVCIQGNWAVKSCNSGFGGTLKKCKRQGVEIEYYDACTKDVSFDTCGSAECDESAKDSKVAELNGAGALCVNKEWTVQTCNTGYIGEKKQCTREGTSYDFYFKCEPEASFQSCGSANCTGEEAAAMKTLHGKPAICINGNWAVQSCDAGYSGTEQQCNRNGVLFKYYHQCTEQSGRNTCGGNNCTGSADSALNGAVPICVGDRWHVTVCNEGYSGQITTCTRDGVPHSYYANGCSKVIVPDGVTVKDLGDGEYAITIERGDKTITKGGKTTNKGDKTTNEGDENTTNNSNTTGDSNSYTYYITSDGGIKTIDDKPGEPGNYTYTTHNGDVYNIENVIIGGAGENDSGGINWNGFLNGSVPMPTGITGGGNANLSIGVGGTSTIDFSRYFDCEDLSVSATSSNDSVTATVDGTKLTIKANQATTKPSTVDVTVNCGDQEQKFKYNVTVQVPEDININTTIQKPVSINFGSKKINLGSFECASNIAVDAKSNNETVVYASASGNNISLTYKKPGTAQVTVQVKCGDNILHEYKYNITVPQDGEDVFVEVIEDGKKGTNFTLKKTTPANEDSFSSVVTEEAEEGEESEENFTVTKKATKTIKNCLAVNVSFSDTVKEYYGRIPIIRHELCDRTSFALNLENKTAYYTSCFRYHTNEPTYEVIIGCKNGKYLQVTDINDDDYIRPDQNLHRTTGVCVSEADCDAQFTYTGFVGDTLLGCFTDRLQTKALDICEAYCRKHWISQDGADTTQCYLKNVVIKDSKCICNNSVDGVWASRSIDKDKQLLGVAK